MLSLRVITWFEYPRILSSGDFRIPLNNMVFTKRIFYAWDEIDFGLPSVYPPRILDPLYFFIAIFQNFQLNLFTSELLAIIIVHFLASILVYNLIKQITEEDIIASFVGTFFLISNIYLINDREITAITFLTSLLIILPSSLVFVKGIKAHSYKLSAVSAILFNLSYATYPNYRTTIICVLTLTLFSLFLFINEDLKLGFVRRKGLNKALNMLVNLQAVNFHLKFWLIFSITLLMSSIWIIAITSMNLGQLISVYERLTIPESMVSLRLYDVMRLIAKWSFYQGAMYKPYIPYRDIYINNPTIVCLSYVPIIIASTSLLCKKKRKMTIYFSFIAVVSLILTSGFSFSNKGSALYRALIELPLLDAFREATHWVFFLIMSLSILIGNTISALCSKWKNKLSKAIFISIILVIFLCISYPLTTGDVARNWLSPAKKGSYLPSSYTELNTMLSSEYWAILLPQRDTYVIYNFSEGPLGCGNPYPLIFSKPIISGAGTEYVESTNLELTNFLYEKIKTDIRTKNIAPEGKVSASSIEKDEYTPKNAIDGQMWTRWSSNKTIPQWLEIEWNKAYDLTEMRIFFEYAYAENYSIEFWNQNTLTATLIVENNTSTQIVHILNQTITATKIHISFTKASKFNSVSIWELEIYAKTEAIPKFLAVLGIKQLVIEKKIVMGNLSSVNDVNLNESETFALIKDWEEVALFENNHALEKLYIANNLLSVLNLNDMYTLTEHLEWGTLKHSVFTNATNLNNLLTLPENFVWKEISSTRYEAELESRGPFVIVFLESFDKNWKLYLNGRQATEDNHFIANMYANGWLIDAKGKVSIVIEYEPQKILTLSIATTVVLLFILLVFLDIKTVFEIARALYKKTKSLKLPKIF